MSNFTTTLVKDSTIADITDKLEYTVVSGGANCTYQSFPATQASSSSLLFNVPVPSENTVVDRSPYVKTSIEFQLRITRVTVGQKAFDYGLRDSLNAFPLNSLFNTGTATINNTTTSTNLKDILPMVTRMTDTQHLLKYNGMTPCLPDQFYHKYENAVGSNANPMSSFNNMSFNRSLMPRGSFPIEAIDITRLPQAGGADAVEIADHLDDVFVVKLKFIVSEPVMLSPFTWCDPEHNSQGLVGINSMSFNFNVDSTLSRLLSSARLQTTTPTGNWYTTIQAGYEGDGKLFAENPAMYFKFLSTQPSDQIQTKNVLPYMDYPRYLTPLLSGQTLAPNASQTFTSSNIQLNQLPDKFVIVARKPMVSQGLGDSNSFFAIKNISLNLNNQSGLLSSATQQDLWRMSMKNGVSQSWVEFYGKAYDNVTNGGDNLATIGSILVLSPALDLSLPDYLSSGSLGNFNLQFSVTVENQTATASQVELCLMCVNSGVFVIERGTSSSFTGILSPEMVMDAKSSKAVSTAKAIRLVGGSLSSNAMAGNANSDRGMSGGGGSHFSGGGGALSGLY